MSGSLIILGGGGHALVVAEGALAAGMTVAGFLDDDPFAPLSAGAPRAMRLAGMDRLDLLDDPACGWIVGVGDLQLRRDLLARLSPDRAAAALVHPSAVVSPSASVGRGAFIAPGAIVNARAKIGPHAIINTGAVIEHECEVGENAHVAPGAALGGRVRVGADTLVGLGSRVLPGVAIGRGCTIGAGAVVTRPVPDGQTVAGTPAAPIAR